MFHQLNVRSILLLFISFLSNYISNQTNNKRHLKGVLKNNEKLKICLKASQNLLNFFNGGNYTIYSYEFNDNKTYIKAFIDFIDGEKNKNNTSFNKYIMHISPYIILVILGFIFFIFWFFLFFFKNKIKKKFLKTVIISLNTIIFFIIIIISLISLLEISELKISLNTATCTIIEFVEEIINGQSESIPDRFLGLSKSIEIINQVQKISNLVKNHSQNFFNNQSSLIESYKIFLGTMMEEYKRIYDINNNSYTNDAIFTFPPEGSLTMLSDNNHTFIFDYVKNYGPFDKNDTELNYVYNLLLNGAKESNDTLFLFIRDIYVVSSDEINELLNSTIYDLFSLFDSLESFYEKIIDRWLFYHDIIENFGLSGLFVCYLILILLSFIIPILKYMIMYKNFIKYQKLFRYIIFISLFCYNIIIFFSFIIGAIIGILGNIGSDLMDVVHFTLTYENLISENPKIIKSSKGIAYASICIDGDGDLRSVFNLDSEYANVFDEMILIKEKFKNFTEILLNNYTESKINIWKTNITNLQKNFILSNITDLTINKSIQIKTLYDNFNKYTMRGYYQNCIDDKWVTKPESDNEYIYYGNIESTPLINSNKPIALYLNEWNSTSSFLRYATLAFSCPINGKLYKSIANAAIYYVDALNALNYANDEYIKVAFQLEKLVEDAFFSLVYNLSNSMFSAINLTNYWDYIYYNVTDNRKGLFTFINCKFAKPILQVVYSEFKEIFGRRFIKVSFIIEIIACLGCLCLFSSVLIFNVHFELKEIKKDDNLKSSIMNLSNTQVQPSIFAYDKNILNECKKSQIHKSFPNNSYNSGNILILKDNIDKNNNIMKTLNNKN